MDIIKHVLKVLDDALLLEGRTANFTADTPLLGALPELDSMAALTLITSLENHFGLSFDDGELNGDTFATVGSLCRMVEAHLSAN